MYRRLNTQPGMSGVLDSISNAVKGVLSSIKITAPPITLPQLPTTYQVPGTQPPPGYGQSQQSAMPDWVMPVALGGVGLLAFMMLTKRGRR